MIKSYKELTVWQKAMEICEDVYRITQEFPKLEQYGLVSQIRRSCVSIPSNISEGFLRGHKAEYIQFLRIAYGSGAELETQLLISLRIGYIDNEDFERINNKLQEVMKMLNTLISKLNNKSLITNH